MRYLFTCLSGLIFGFGLTLSGMLNPYKVYSFLDISRNWDPSLAFVMIGALIVSSPMFHLIKNNKKPLFTDSFNYSKNKDINNRLIIGSSLFGAGWGLGGLCPGPAISSIALLNINSITFVVAMFIGFYLVKFFKLSS